MSLSYLSQLSTPDDQMANQFSVTFIGKPVLNIQEMTLRMDKTLDIPENVVTKTDIKYQGFTIPKINSQEETDKSFSLNFRLDENWMVYNTLNIWYGKTFNPRNASTKPIDDRHATLIFQAFKKNREVSRTIIFKFVQIMSIKLTEFDNSSNEPSRVEAKFIYAYKEDPINDFFI